MEMAWAKTLTCIWLPIEASSNIQMIQIVGYPTTDLVQVKDFNRIDAYWEIELATPLQLGIQYEVKTEKGIHPVSFRLYTATSDFFEKWHVLGERFGVDCSGQQTQFTIWAPTAYQIDLLLMDETGTKARWAMERKETGVWKRSFTSCLHGLKYLYEISVDGMIHTVVDPYAIAATPNGEAGIVIDTERSQTVKKIPLPTLKNHEKIIYETSIRDFTVSSTSDVIRKGKYLGFTDEEPLDYLTDLGVTYAQLMPVQKFFGVDERNPKEQYNWGYNPLLYFVPEGSYSINPENPLERILEMKELVYRLHRKNIRVILDVVYNHVYHIETHVLDKIVPGYYIRTHADGTYVDSCGCGNDLATERPMVRKLIVDSLLYWVQTFDVDGFRFDLMGNMDIETMKEIYTRLTDVKQDLLFLGEGWNLGTTLPNEQKATMENAAALPMYGFFNDIFRDGVKGSIFDVHGTGFATGAPNQGYYALQLFLGNYRERNGHFQPIQNPQSINYIECHDNHTIADKLSICCAHEGIDTRKRRQQLMTAYTLLAQGIPFLHSGQEFFRSKKGESNTYNLSDAYNAIDWTQIKNEQEAITWIQDVIRLRKSNGVFGLANFDKVQKRGYVLEIWADGFAFVFDHVGHLGAYQKICVAFHFGMYDKELAVYDWENAHILLDMDGDFAKYQKTITQSQIKLSPLSVMIIGRK